MINHLDRNPGLTLLLERYLFLLDKDRVCELLDSCRSSVQEWRYSRIPMFPELPFIEELHYGGQWVAESKDTFRHGFDHSGKLILIEWRRPVAYRRHEGYLEATFGPRTTRAIPPPTGIEKITAEGQPVEYNTELFREVDVEAYREAKYGVLTVMHIYEDELGRTTRVISLTDDYGYDREYIYEEGRLNRIHNRCWEHKCFNERTVFSLTNEERSTDIFQYSVDGLIRGSRRLDADGLEVSGYYLLDD